MRPKCMRVKSLEIRTVRLPFRFAFTHATATRRCAESLILTLTTENGERGYGECAPRSYLTGETLESCLKTLRDELWPRLCELSFLASERPDLTLAALHDWAQDRRLTAAYAGLDIAVFDAWARTFTVPGEQMLGTSRRPYPVTVPLGLGMPAALSLAATRLARFTELKVKVGRDFEAEWRDLRRLRRLVGRDVGIRVDANGAWSEAETIVRAARLADLGVTSIEQPLAAGDLPAWQRVESSSALPLMLDESLCTLTDARAMIAHGISGPWNLRLAKVGGFSGVLRLMDMATAAGVRYQLGVLVGESSLLHAALRACLGAASPLHVESAFPGLLLREDPFSCRGSAARVFGDCAAQIGPLGKVPGLGVEPNMAALARQTVAIEILGEP